MLSLAVIALLPIAALAKTDLAGCASTTIGGSITYYLPENGEICKPVDCGGGRAPPKTVPGCPAYSGTETITPSFLPNYKPAEATAAPAPATGADGSMTIVETEHVTSTVDVVVTKPLSESPLGTPIATGAEGAEATGAAGASEGGDTENINDANASGAGSDDSSAASGSGAEEVAAASETGTATGTEPAANASQTGSAGKVNMAGSSLVGALVVAGVFFGML